MASYLLCMKILFNNRKYCIHKPNQQEIASNSLPNKQSARLSQDEKILISHINNCFHSADCYLEISKYFILNQF